MPGYMICIDASGLTSPGGNPVGIVALNGRNGDVPLEGVGPAPVYYDHHSIAQETAGYAAVGRPYTNAEWINCRTSQWDLNDGRNRTFLGGPYVGANTPINFEAFKNGVFTITGFTVTRTGNSGEGAAIHIDLQTLAIPNGFSIYWTLTALTGAAQNGFTPSSGSTVVTSTYVGNWPGTAARITLTPDLDNITEGAGSFVMQIHRLGVTGAIFYILPAISVGDTSLYPYFGTVPASISEGDAGTFNVTGYDITGNRSPATYYWSAFGGTGRLVASSGSFPITNNAGSFTITPLANLTTNGATTVTVSLRIGSVTGTVIATTTFTINDTSQTPAFTAPTGAVSINEGSAQSFSVSGYTNGAAFAATWYWYINHITTVAADFSGGVTNGSFTLNNGGSFSITPLADNLSDGSITNNRISPRNETFTVSIARTNLGTAVATSPIITANDTSLSPAATITWTFANRNNGATIDLSSHTTQNGATVTQTGPYVVGRSGNNLNVIIPVNIWVAGGLTLTNGDAGDTVSVTVNGTLTAMGGVGAVASLPNPGGVGLNFSAMAPTVLTLSGTGLIAGGGGAGGFPTTICSAPGDGAGGSVADQHGQPQLCNGFPGCYAILLGTRTFGVSGGPTGTFYYRDNGTGGAKIVTTSKANNAYVGIGARQTAASGELLNRCFSSIINKGMGGAQGGGGGITYQGGLGCSFLGKGGTGGVLNAAGGNASGGGTGNAVQRSQVSTGGGGGWGAPGGNGFCTWNGTSHAGGAGGLAIKTGGKTLNGSVTTRWGGIGT